MSAVSSSKAPFPRRGFRYVLEALYEKINEVGHKGTVLPFPKPPDFPWRA